MNYLLGNIAFTCMLLYILMAVYVGYFGKVLFKNKIINIILYIGFYLPFELILVVKKTNNRIANKMITFVLFAISYIAPFVYLFLPTKINIFIGHLLIMLLCGLCITSIIIAFYLWLKPKVNYIRSTIGSYLRENNVIQ